MDSFNYLKTSIDKFVCQWNLVTLGKQINTS